MMSNSSTIKHPWWYGGAACSISLLCAVLLTGVVLAYPKAFAPEGLGSVNHGLLSLMMWGIAAGFVHGVGLTLCLRYIDSVFQVDGLHQL